MKDYDFELAYHPGKANVVADALSRRSHVASLLASREWRLMADMANAVYKVLRQQGSAFVPVAASSQDAQLTHMLEILQAHTKNISTRLEAFNDGLVSSINRYDHSIQDATLRIETVILQLKNVLKKSPLFS